METKRISAWPSWDYMKTLYSTASFYQTPYEMQESLPVAFFAITSIVMKTIAFYQLWQKNKFAMLIKSLSR